MSGRKNFDLWPDAWVASWKEGVSHFNDRRFWDAHEAWERGWLRLPPKHKLHIQALIQAAGVFHLLHLGRVSPAKRLAWRALEKLSPGDPDFPRIEVNGLETALRAIANAPAATPARDLEFLSTTLKAALLLSSHQC